MDINAENRFSDFNPTRVQLLEIAANLIAQAVSPTHLKDAFQVAVDEGESIYATMIRSGTADNEFDAVACVGRRFPPKTGTWNDLAKWVAEYEFLRTHGAVPA